MSEKLDLLIKECGVYFDTEAAKFEAIYKKFVEDYNKAITNTQEFEIFKANGDDTKIWPKDVFPDTPEIKTYGDLYKWLFNLEYGTVYYNEKDVRYDDYTGKEEVNPKSPPISGGGGIDNLPYKLYKKLHSGLDDNPNLDPVQSALFDPLYESYDDVKRYKQYVYCRDVIKAENYSKKVIEVILREIDNDYISSKWTPQTPDDMWYRGYPSKQSSGHDYSIGLWDFIAREYPFSQDYYGGTSFLYLYSGNPWSKKTTLYDALIEAIKEKPAPVAPAKPIETNSVKDNTSPTNLDPLAVTGKFSLKVKSGPGVIIGVTEVDITNGKADFSGIEFDQAGDYVISVACTSPDVDPMEINIKILPQPEVIPQESKGATESNASGTRPIIAQIDRPTLDLKPMSFDTQGASIASSKQVATTIGLTPFLNYNGSQINDRDIQSLILEHQGMIPKVSIIFRDTNGIMSKEPPRDDSKFEVFLQSRSPNLKSIHLKFKIENFGKLQSNQYSLDGTLDISGLYRNKFTVKRGTSFEVLREICKDLKIGFNSNIDNTKDNMPWRNIGDKQYKFMEEIIKHSYISDGSFMAGYIDFYYCFNYVDIEKEMKRDISKDVGIDTGGIDTPDKRDTDKIEKLVLTSEKGMQSSNNFFIKKSERNESTKISMEQGYRTRTKFYDKVKKMFLVFDVDSTTSDGAKSIIMKAGEGDKEAFDNNYVTKYQGKIDTDNTHVNYNYAVTQNKINLDNMMKNQLDISLPNPNFNLYRFQKIQIFIVKAAATVSAPEIVEWRYSGEWMIASIKFTFNGSSLMQDITLARKEMGKDPEEIKAGTNNGTKEKKEEKNENPIVGTASSTITNKPNEKYKVGDIFTVQNSDGTKYVLTVAKLSENGTDIVATLKDPSIVPNPVLTSPDTVVGVTQSTLPVEPTATPIVATSSGSYPFTVTLEKAGGNTMIDSKIVDTEDISQEEIVRRARSHPERSAPNLFDGSQITTTREENIEKHEEHKLYLAIKRPVPVFKHDNDMPPKNWVLFELSDYGIDKADSSGKSDNKKLWQKIKSRLFNGHESRLIFKDEGYNGDWEVPKGYIKIMDESGKVVDDTSKSWDPTTKLGANSDWNIDGQGGGQDLTWQWGGSTQSGWYDYTGKVPASDVYPELGVNIIWIDMSNGPIKKDANGNTILKKGDDGHDFAERVGKYEPGVYTIEVKYYVPVYEKYNTDGENLGKTYNGTGLWSFKDERILTKDSDGHNPYEAKILKGTFTIVKKSKKK